MPTIMRALQVESNDGNLMRTPCQPVLLFCTDQLNERVDKIGIVLSGPADSQAAENCLFFAQFWTGTPTINAIHCAAAPI